MHTMMGDGAQKVKDGIITLQELVRYHSITTGSFVKKDIFSRSC